jgi:hypothetical protein
MKTSPFKAMTERFGDKQKLVSALEKLVTDELWLKRVNEEKGLGRVSNKKLLHLHDLLSRVKKEFGSRAKLIDSILELMKRQKDEGLRGRLQGFPTPRLVDLHTTTARRSKVAVKSDAPKEKKTPAEKKAAAEKKKPAAKKAAPAKAPANAAAKAKTAAAKKKASAKKKK